MIDEQIPVFISADDISQKIEEIDRLLALQLDAILHHPEFKAIEAAWRGVFYLVNQIEDNLRVRIRIIHAAKKELLVNFEQKDDLKETAFYQKIFSDVYVGGHDLPTSLLIGVYEFDYFAQDLLVIGKMSEIAALAYTPFIAAVSPSMFAWETFEEIDGTRDMSRHCRLPQYVQWNKFRDSEEARFVGLCMPHILLREPYQTDKIFTYRESSEKSDMLRGNAAFAFAGCVARAFCEKSWLGKINASGGDGTIENLPALFDEQNRKYSLDADLGKHSPAISDLGFMSLIEDNGGTYFFDSRSTGKPKSYDTEGVTEFFKKCANIENILAMSRFVVNIMSFRRDNFYRFEGRHELRLALMNWLEKYFHADDNTPDEIKAVQPLREFYLDVVEKPGEPNAYTGVLFIRPTYLLDNLELAMRAVIYFPDLK